MKFNVAHFFAATCKANMTPENPITHFFLARSAVELAPVHKKRKKKDKERKNRTSKLNCH